MCIAPRCLDATDLPWKRVPGEANQVSQEGKKSRRQEPIFLFG